MTATVKIVIGIDVGGSTTKIVGFRTDDPACPLIEPLFVQATDPLTSAYGAFGKFLDKNGLSLSDIARVMMTGVGAGHMKNGLYGLPCRTVPEFDSIGLGGLYLSGLDNALTVSLGTGTALVHAVRGDSITYLGGTGVGGGTLMGLSKLLLKAESVNHIADMAAEGDLSHVDLRIGDISAESIGDLLQAEVTAANFGNVTELATEKDIARGILNMVFETVGMISVFAARSRGTEDIVLTGNLTEIDACRKKFEQFNRMGYGVRFCIPERARFATVIGTALSAEEMESVRRKKT